VKGAEKFLKFLSWISWLSIVWLVFYPYPYDWAMSINLILPLITFAVWCWFDIVSFSEPEKQINPILFTSFVIPSFGLALRSIIDFNLLNYSKIWIYGFLVALLLFGIIFFRIKGQNLKTKLQYLEAFSFFLFCYLYGCSTIIPLNCWLDNSQPIDYSLEILDKRINSGDLDYYYFVLEPLSAESKELEAKISENLYDQKEIGDSVKISMQEGKLGIPWFDVNE